MNDQLRPQLGENAFPADLIRELCLDVHGHAIFEEDLPPERWSELDAIEPTECSVARMRLALLSASLDEKLTRAVYEIEDFPTDTPLLGPTQPRMGDIVKVDVGFETALKFRVDLTHGEMLAGVETDIGPNELLLSQCGMVLGQG
jgi:hypothetical protein